MPYSIEERPDGFVVVKKGTGKVVGKVKSKAAGEAMIKAIYANEGKMKEEKYDPISGKFEMQEGGSGSGNFGHGGRPGERGGSSEEGGSDNSTSTGTATVGQRYERDGMQILVYGISNVGKVPVVHAVSTDTGQKLIMDTKEILKYDKIPYAPSASERSYADSWIRKFNITPETHTADAKAFVKRTRSSGYQDSNGKWKQIGSNNK